MVTGPFRWTDWSDDPNAPAVLRARAAVLDSARRPPVADRNRHLMTLARGRAVLDVGVVEHRAASAASGRWLHRRLAEVADRCVGIDILADDVAVLVAEGHDVRVHDLTAGPLGDEPFDVVVLGDVAEHVDDPVALLDGARRSLAPGGRVVLTTPNPYLVHRAWQHLRGGFPDSADHGVLLGPGQVLALASRAGLTLETWRGVRLKDLKGWRNRVASLLRRALVATVFAEEAACDTLIYELVVASEVA